MKNKVSLRPVVGTCVVVFDEESKEWISGTLLAYTYQHSHAIVEKDDGSIVMFPKDTKFILRLNNGRY